MSQLHNKKIETKTNNILGVHHDKNKPNHATESKKQMDVSHSISKTYLVDNLIVPKDQIKLDTKQLV